jgi:small nuclear ribonucleoprotein (snRNP)-like protein
MSCLQAFANQFVQVEVSGKKCIRGHLVEYGPDILVIHHEGAFHFIPLLHIQNITSVTELENDAASLNVPEHPFHVDGETISLRKMLSLARGHFVEIYVSGNTTIHGYLTSVMNDYFVFHSPVYKTIFITLHHLKWLIPYHEDVTPYALDAESIPHHSSLTSLARTFKEQCKKLTGSLVVFDMGDHPNKIGQLTSVDTTSNMVELFTAGGEKYYYNLHHLKTVYLP